MNNTEQAIESGAQTLQDKTQAKAGAAIVYQDSVFLVVDDFEIMRKVTAAQLKSLGAKEILVANNGVEALRILHAQHVDIVLSDWNMPLLSGLDLLKAVRCDEQLYRLPFVMIMTEIERKRVEQAIASGVSALMLKPYTTEHLAMRIDKAMTWTPHMISTPALQSVASALADSTSEQLAADAQAQPELSQRPCILIVDDAEDNLLLLSELFKDEYQVRIAQKGKKALEICFSDNPPDLVLLDVLMPDMDGFEVARRMREHPLTASIPVIFVTALNSEEARLLGLALGAVDFVSKPIDAQLLKPRVRSFMRYVALHKQLQADYDEMLEAAQMNKITQASLDDNEPQFIANKQRFAAADTMHSQHAPALLDAEATALQELNFTYMSSELFQIENGLYKLAAKAVNITDILQHIVEVSRAGHADKNLSITLDTDVPVPQALADSMLCSSLFQSLMENACAAAPRNSRVAIKLYNRSPLRITIENSGVVAANLRAIYFKKPLTQNQQADTAIRAYAAKLLSQAQGGSIELDVSDEADTTTLIVHLPRFDMQAEETKTVPKDEGSSRIKIFSDAVFGIAITLLVLGIKLPLHSEVAQNGLTYTLAAMWPSYLAFISSFITILVLWVRHRRLFTLIDKTDPAFLYLNGLLLFFIALLPFPTALLAEYLLHAEASVAVSIYTGTLLAISFTFIALWRHASRNMLQPALFSNGTAAKLSTLQDRLAPPLFLIAFGVSFFSAAAAIAMTLMLSIFFASCDLRAKS